MESHNDSGDSYRKRTRAAERKSLENKRRRTLFQPSEVIGPNDILLNLSSAIVKIEESYDVKPVVAAPQTSVAEEVKTECSITRNVPKEFTATTKEEYTEPDIFVVVVKEEVDLPLEYADDDSTAKDTTEQNNCHVELSTRSDDTNPDIRVAEVNEEVDPEDNAVDDKDQPYLVENQSPSTLLTPDGCHLAVPVQEPSQQTNKVDLSFYCHICDMVFGSKLSLALHRRVHSKNKSRKPTNNFQCPHCQKCFTRKFNLQRHNQIHSNDFSFACVFCDELFCQQELLYCHIRSHTDEVPFTCKQCGKSFKNEASMYNHRYVHVNEDEYTVCVPCGKRFKSKKGFNYHNNVTHLKSINFLCVLCPKPKYFTTICRLNDHVRWHCQEQPYQCNVCESCFSSSQQKIRHTLKFHG